jgi:hypothetical protein
MVVGDNPGAHHHSLNVERPFELSQAARQSGSKTIAGCKARVTKWPNGPYLRRRSTWATLMANRTNLEKTVTLKHMLARVAGIEAAIVSKAHRSSILRFSRASATPLFNVKNGSSRRFERNLPAFCSLHGAQA